MTAFSLESPAHPDRDRNTVGQHIEHGRAGASLVDDLLELLTRRIAFDFESDADGLEAVPHLVRNAEDALKIDVALDERADLGQLHPAGSGDVSDAGRETGGE